MKDLTLLPNEWRDSGAEVQIYGVCGGAGWGVFLIPSPIDKAPMRVIASTDAAWEHVSVSRAKRCPNWPEMCFIKEQFFSDNEAVMQLHPPRSDYVHHHPFCLHLWRPILERIPRPEAWRVGPMAGAA